MRRSVTVLLCLALVAPLAHGAMVSKKFQFKVGTTLEVGEDIEGGIRLDSVQFNLPAAGKAGLISRVSGIPEAIVAISNMSKQAHKVGIAVAVFDKDGRLLGVANGGSALRGIKPYRQVGYRLVFDGVNAELADGVTFQISVEIAE